MKIVTLFFLSLTLLTSCLKTRADIEAEQNNQQMEKQTVAQQKTNVVVKEKAPPSAYRFEEYDEEMRNLSGRVDTLENSVAQVHAAKQNDVQATAKEKQALDQRFQAYEDELKKMETQITALNDEIARLKT